MKRLIPIGFILLLGVVMAAAVFYFWATSTPSAAPFPKLFSESESMVFTDAFGETWKKIGLRPGYVATVQPEKITAKNSKGETKVFRKNLTVGFQGWKRDGKAFVYTFSFAGEIYTFRSSYPFELLYEVRTDQPKLKKNLWGLRPKNEKKHFKEIYQSFMYGILDDISHEDLRFSWLRRMDQIYQNHFGGRMLITTNRCKESGLTPAQIYRLKYNLDYADITPAMEETHEKLVRRGLMYVQVPDGVLLLDNDFNKFEEQRTQPYFNLPNLKSTPFLFLGYTYRNNRKYIATSFMGGNDTIFAQVGFFDDLLPVAPASINYKTLVEDISAEGKPTCDAIALAFVYLDRQLHFNLLNNPDNPERFKEIIQTLSNQTAQCEISTIGPKKKKWVTRKQNRDYVLESQKPPGYESEKISILPDPLVRAYYNNLDFLIPVWSHYNAKEHRRRETGIIKIDGGRDNERFRVLRGDYTVEMPTLRDLLISADLSTLLQGHGFERIVYDRDESIVATPGYNYREVLREIHKKNENAAIFQTQDSYFNIARIAYQHEVLAPGEVDIIAKSLREFNQLLKNQRNLRVGGSQIRILQQSPTAQRVTIPVEMELLGIERRPKKRTIRYKFNLNYN